MPNFAPLFPLFVPSFSSKGNLLLCQPDGTYISDNYSLLQELDLRVSKSYLVSAYDIYYGLMPRNPRDMPETEYLFIDSGGYETNDSFDLSERNKFNYHVIASKIAEWNISDTSTKDILSYIDSHFSSLNELPQIPEKHFNRLKHKHQSKVEMSKFLDSHKKDFWVICRLKFRFSRNTDEKRDKSDDASDVR